MIYVLFGLRSFVLLLILSMPVFSAPADEAGSQVSTITAICKLAQTELAAIQRKVAVMLKPSLTGKVILIDAGHGGKDSGACRLGIREKDITLRLAKQLKLVFEERGATVFLTREDDIDLELQDICDIVEKRKPHVFISLHVNSSPLPDTKVSGLQTFFRTQHSRLLAHTTHALVLRKGVCADRKVFSSQFWVLRSNSVPSILIETGYINCRLDRKRLLDSRFRLALCDGIADGVTAFWKKKGLLKAGKP